MRSNLRQGRARLRELLASLGFMMVALGILSTGARGAGMEEVEACLESLARLEADRVDLLSRAEVLGREQARSGERSEDALRQAESIQSRALELELQILLEKTRCRALVQDVLDQIEPRIDSLERKVLEGRATPEEAESLVAFRADRSALQRSLASRIVHRYPILPLGPEDTRETLRDKLQYYDEVQENLVALRERIAEREKKVRQEAEALREARRLVGDLAFADMGDRTSGERSSTLRLKLPDDDAGTGDPGRDGSTVPWDEVGSDLEFALRLAANTPEESERILEVLETFRNDIERELRSIAGERETIRDRIEGEPLDG